MTDSKIQHVLATAAASVATNTKRYRSRAARFSVYDVQVAAMFRDFALESECCCVELRKLQQSHSDAAVSNIGTGMPKDLLNEEVLPIDRYFVTDDMTAVILLELAMTAEQKFSRFCEEARTESDDAELVSVLAKLVASLPVHQTRIRQRLRSYRDHRPLRAVSSVHSYA